MPSREALLQAVEAVNRRCLGNIAADEPGGVLLLSTEGEPLASASAGVASLETRRPLAVSTPLDVGSVAKTVTGLAVAILEQEGALSPSTRVSELLPLLPPYMRTLRIEHLVHQESGLRSYFTFLYYMAGWHPRRPPTADEVLEALCRVGSLAFAPGSRYEYSDSNYFLLARLVERATGQAFGAFAREHILDPLGMRDTWFADGDPVAAQAEGYLAYALAAEDADCAGPYYPARLRYRHVGAEGLCSSARDLARLGRHILHPSLVSPETMRRRILHAPRVREDGLGYGYGLNVGTYRGRRYIGHDGAIWGATASLAIFPDDGFEILCLTNREDLGAWSLRSALLDAIDGRVSPAPERTAEGGSRANEADAPSIDREARRELEGSYASAELGVTFDVLATEAGIRLANRDPRRDSMNLEYVPKAPDHFESRHPYPDLSQIVFLRDRGSVRGFVYRDPDGDRREDLRFDRLA